jgi:RDD family
MENGASRNGRAPIPARLLGVGFKGARTVTKATGIDRAVEVAAEEAIVAAVESQAVERAMARVLEGPVVQEAVEGALESDAVKKALLEAMDSELVDEVWKRLLASDQAQQLVERIAEAPEVRAAISAQGMGLVEDVGRTIGKTARRLDDRFERIVRRIFFRPQRVLPTDRAGFVSRGTAMLVDGVFVNLAFTAFIALVTLLANAFGGNGEGGTGLVIAIGSTAWLAFGAVYLLGFWSLAGQTPGMRFLGVPHRGAPAAAAQLPASGRPRPLGAHLRHRVPRRRLRRAAPRLGRPPLGDRSRLRRPAPRAGPLVDPGQIGA